MEMNEYEMEVNSTTELSRPQKISWPAQNGEHGCIWDFQLRFTSYVLIYKLCSDSQTDRQANFVPTIMGFGFTFVENLKKSFVLI